MYESVIEKKIGKKTEFTVYLVCDVCCKDVVRTCNRGQSLALIKRKHHFCDHKCYGQSRKKGGLSYIQAQETCVEKFGASHHMKSPDFKKTFDDKLEEKYGVRNTSQTEEVRKKLSIANLKPDVVEKHRHAWSGDNNPAKRSEVKEKIMLGLKEWCQKTHGVDNPSQIKEIYERGRQTCLERFGDVHPIRVLEDKRRETCNERYGAPNPSQAASVMDKIMLAKWGQTWKERNDSLPEYEKYTRAVWRCTNMQPLETLVNYDKRGIDFHLDHKFSIAEGFRQNLSPEVIGNIANLQILSSHENILKSDSCSISKDDLLLEIEKIHQ